MNVKTVKISEKDFFNVHDELKNRGVRLLRVVEISGSDHLWKEDRIRPKQDWIRQTDHEGYKIFEISFIDIEN